MTFISFIIPARNEALYLAACIAAIRKQQLSNPYEIIVVDNASTDTTTTIANDLGARVVREEKIGLSHVRAKGVASARGEIIVFVDADTRLPSTWTLQILEYFKKHQDVVAISCGFSFYDGRFYENLGSFFVQLPNPLYNCIFQCLGRPHFLLGQSFALKKNALLEAGGIDMDFPFYAEDLGLAVRLNAVGKVRYLSSLTVATSARRYHKQGFFKTTYVYFVPLLLFMLGMSKQLKQFASKHTNQI